MSEPFALGERRRIAVKVIDERGNELMRVVDVTELTAMAQINAVETPIINSPYEEPKHHWHIEEGKQPREAGGPPAGELLLPRARAGGARPQGAASQGELFEDDVKGQEYLLDLANLIRQRVQEWRERDYEGATKVTRELLDLWRSPDRAQRLFYAQLEAAETVHLPRRGAGRSEAGHPGADGRAGRGGEGGGLQGVPALRAQDGDRHRQDDGDGDAGRVVDPQQGGRPAERRSTPTRC